MSALARKVVRSRWPDEPPVSEEALWADSVTGACLRTQENKLSVWRIEPKDWREVVLALACRFDKIETFDLVWLDEEELSRKMCLFQPSPGETHVEDLRDKHMDIVELSYPTVGILAMHAASRICAEGWNKRVLIAETRDTLLSAIRANRLDPAKLSVKVRKAIGLGES